MLYSAFNSSGTGSAYSSGAFEFIYVFLYGLAGFMLFILSNYVFTYLVQSCDAYYDFHVKPMFNSSLLHQFCQEFIFVFIYTQICPTRYPYHMMFMSINSNTTCITSGAANANPSGGPEFTPPFLCGVCVARSLVFCVVS